jgi:hypothetical protein
MRLWDRTRERLMRIDPRGIDPRGIVRRAATLLTCRIAPLLQTSPFVTATVSSLALPRELATMMSSAAKGTTQVDPPGVPRMRQKPDPTVTTADGAVCQIRTLSQRRIERQLILANERNNTIVLVPVDAELIQFRDRDYKNARFSVKIENVFSISSSYSLVAKASRGRARSFLCALSTPSALILTAATFGESQPLSLIARRCAAVPFTLLGKDNGIPIGTAPFLIPSSCRI